MADPVSEVLAGNVGPAFDYRAVLRQIAEELGVIGGKAAAATKTEDKTVSFKEVTVKRTVVRPEQTDG